MAKTGKIMTKEELDKFVESIGRCELYDEIEECKKYHKSRNLYYFKAIMVCLNSFGYDEDWIDTDVKNALRNYYLYPKKNKMSDEEIEELIKQIKENTVSYL